MTHDRQRRSTAKVAVPSARIRRLAPWIAFIALMLVGKFYFTTFQNSLLMKSTLEALGSNRNQQRIDSGPLHVLLVAYARTGSSFIGDLLQSLPNSFYHFEPIHFIQENVLNNSFDDARNLLERLFLCNISQIEGFLPWQKKHKSFMKLQRNIRYWEKCSKNNSCFDGTYIDRFCRDQSTVIAKTIRLNLREASKLFETHPHLNLKIIYLTRDPRGTRNSRMKKPINFWCKHDPACFNFSHFCAGISSDVDTTCALTTNRPRDFMVIRYEDVSYNPYGVASQIVKFLGLSSIPREMDEFLKTHTFLKGSVKHKPKVGGVANPYSTFRNSSLTAMSWRKEMTFKSVQRLQDICRPFLNAFGYHSYETLSSLRLNDDMNINIQKALESRCNSSST